ncbi:inositol monophosphatase family protein [Phormidium tenue FACHB-886]|nr:inositol monophosphatase family protein [Phormidium tenue FACHB-886]
MRFSAEQLQAIQTLIRQCGQQARASGSFQVYEKGWQDYVTDVDRALDAQLTAGFSRLFPKDGVITEENPQSWQVLYEGRDRLWLIDPLDGTDDFIQGKPDYAVMVGLLQAEQPVAGWVYAPAADRLYFGGEGIALASGAGGGAEGNLFQQCGDQAPVPLVPTPPPDSPDECLILLGEKDQKRFGPAIAAQIPCARFDTIGSFGLKVLQVICGQAGLYLYLNQRVKLWDTTAPLAMAKAAGLVCCDLTGKPIRFTAEALRDNLAHRQPILIGWAKYVETLRSPLQQAVATISQQLAD